MRPIKKPSLSIGTWIYLALLATVVAAVVPLMSIVHSHVRTYAEEQASAALRQLAWEMRDALDRGMERHYEEISVLAQLKRETLLGSQPANARASLEAMQRSFPDMTWIGYADIQGRVLVATGGLLEGKDVSARPWFQGAQDKPFVGNLHPAVLLDKLLPPQAEPRRFVDIALPIRADDGSVHGVLGLHLNWNWARDAQHGLVEPTLEDRAVEMLVLDHDGTVLLGPSDTEGQKIDLGIYGPVPPGGAALAVLEQQHTQGYMETQFSAMVRTQGRARYPGLGWVVLVRQPGVVALESYQTLSRKILAASMAVAVAVVLGGLLLTHTLSRPLRQLRNLVDARTRREDVSELPPVRGYREVDQLSDALSAMVAEESRLNRELLSINTTLEERVLEKTAEARLRETRLRDITDNLPVLITYIDRGEHLRFINATSREWLDVEPEKVMGRPVEEVFSVQRHGQDMPSLRQAMSGTRLTFESTYERGGQQRTLLTTCVPDIDDDGSVAGIYTLSHDITAARAAEIQLQSLARVDTLTRLPNRYSFNEKLAEALARNRRAGKSVALLFLDVDHFKSINDSFGHAAGDAVLVEFARRLTQSVRVTDTVARLAGDEFVIVLEGLNGENDPQAVARKIVAGLQRPFDIDGRMIQVTSSIGIAYHHEGVIEPAQFLAQADSALYRAKAAGRNTFRSLAA